MNAWINLPAVWRILLFGVLFGAGVPAVFTVGLRALAAGSRSSARGAAEGRARWPRIATAGVCFGCTAAVAGWGIYQLATQS